MKPVERWPWQARLAIIVLLLFVCWAPVIIGLHLIGLLD